MPNETKRQSLSLDEVSQMAKALLLKDGFHRPTLIVEGTDQSIVLQIQPIAATSEGRAQQLFVIGLRLALVGEVGVLQQAFFISEAWLSMAQPGETPSTAPSEDPKRKEVLIIARQEYSQGQDSAAIFEMKRNAKGNLIAVEAHISEDTTNAENWLLNGFSAGFAAGLLAGFDD